MTNKSSSKQHGLVDRGRPKSKSSKRANKLLARVRRLERQAAQNLRLAEALKKVSS